MIPHKSSPYPATTYFKDNWPSLALTSLPISDHSLKEYHTLVFKTREKTLEGKGRVFSSLKCHLWYWQLFFFSQKALPVTLLLFSTYVVASDIISWQGVVQGRAVRASLAFRSIWHLNLQDRKQLSYWVVQKENDYWGLAFQCYSTQHWIQHAFCTPTPRLSV